MVFRACVALLFITLLNNQLAFGWGERGHDLIARVAARIVLNQLQNSPQEYSSAMIRKELMLGHLANVPDIVWRNGDPKTVEINGPTHYIDTDGLLPEPTFKTLPRTIADAQTLAKKSKRNVYTDIGTAPWRVAQLSKLMYEAIAKVAQEPKEQEKYFNQYLLHAGILAHFVGDLSQPLHTVLDYDGYAKNQGGVHGYFEEAIVEAFNLDLDYEVFASAVKEKPFKKKIAHQLAGNLKPTQQNFDQYALEVALALAMDSYHQLNEVLKLDRTLALLSPSKSEPIKIAAKRKPAHEVADAFRGLIIERLSLGADTLAHLWLEAWKTAGSPALNNYKSYEYFLAPEFIAPNY